MVDFYFEANEFNQLEHGLQKYALYPVKDYKDILPDSVRFFLNRDYWDDYNRDNQRQ
jgi:hypothetical protein